jgi:uncharacterized membrane protein
MVSFVLVSIFNAPTELNRLMQGELPLDRVEAFSDGGSAIVTLLVLDLNIPSSNQPAARLNWRTASSHYSQSS